MFRICLCFPAMFVYFPRNKFAKAAPITVLNDVSGFPGFAFLTPPEAECQEQKNTETNTTINKIAIKQL